jgi:tRNA dimethylallyltransferase
VNTLAVILGPTGVGKTETCLSLADFFHSPIISADSRQMYSEIPIGTAAPNEAEMARVKHYFIGNLKLDEYYSAAKYEDDAVNLANTLFADHNPLIITGGSMMYIDAICNGIDDIPTVTDEVRKTLIERYNEYGLDSLASELRLLDPEYFKEVDRKNPKRVIHALEICYMTGRPYSSFRSGKKKTRPFNIIKVGLSRPREELYDRINRRVDYMIENGLVDEAKKVYYKRHLNSLNTVGFKELFRWMDGAVNNDGSPWTLEYAIDKIKQNSRIYSRKQMTWFKRDAEIKWFHPDETDAIKQYIKESIHDIEAL